MQVGKYAPRISCERQLRTLCVEHSRNTKSAFATEVAITPAVTMMTQIGTNETPTRRNFREPYYRFPSSGRTYYLGPERENHSRRGQCYFTRLYTQPDQ